MKARRLGMVEINDDETSDLGSVVANYLSHRQVRSVEGATRLLLEGSAGRDNAGDMFVIDVNFEKSTPDRLRDLKWANENADNDKGTNSRNERSYPWGPLLVLPFLQARRTNVFIPFSSGFQGGAIARNGFVAVAYSLIHAVTTNSETTLGEGADALGLAATDAETPAVPYEAALLACGRYRRRLQELSRPGGPVRVCGFAKTRDQLRWILNSGEAVGVPWRTPDGELLAPEFEFRWPEETPDVERQKIELSSLYGDLLEFAQQPTAQQLRAVLTDFEAWTTGSQVGEEQHTSQVSLPHVSHVWKQLYKGHQRITELADPEMRRHLHNIAWLTAWEVRIRGGVNIKYASGAVREWLGLPEDYKLYRLFFPDDNNQRMPDPDADLSWEIRPYRRDWRDHVRKVQSAIERGDKTIVRDLASLWSLDTMENDVELSRREVDILRQFARDVMQWEGRRGSRYPWPKWLQD